MVLTKESDKNHTQTNELIIKKLIIFEDYITLTPYHTLFDGNLILKIIYF